MRVEIVRFKLYNEAKGNAKAFADVRVYEVGHVYEYKDVKLYSDGVGLHISPKQVKTEYGWAYSYLIPRAFQAAIRRALIKRYETEKIGQLVLV